ncbi:1-deoxy-D-xylulose-5-phosphate reductoisomerase [Flaviflexus huanghaiensis]|uniref:1-deoxy-D-xylulose-5-phosphate reductoisomerase n=1 Tax=Flaviflexus huanghaiensis TaxID=1111473 RepID=UPI0015FAF033|nr:1-deoxy-D-xylulose-5-phosphate reductoisomerase [Flaviflexus huanghaiensis]
MNGIVILGSTGSIGTQALDVVRRGGLSVAGLSAGGGNLELLAQQAADFSAPVVGIADSSRVDALQAELDARGISPHIVSGPQANVEIARLAPDGTVLNGITGSIGLPATLAALESGATLALANKESMVAGGTLVRDAMVRPGQIVPVDSEHSAIAQALLGGRHEKGLTSPVVTGISEVRRLILTASGGPFRGRRRSELASVTAAQALDHPTWDMGPVVTINSSTLMNKGLELIEAALLFDIPPADILPVVHPQSIIHSMVEFVDGSTLAQASPPDMRLPIALGLTWPERLADVAAPCSWDSPVEWTFEPVDHETFPALNLAKSALEAGPLHPAVLNAANEEAVAAFLQGSLGYLAMGDLVERVLGEFDSPSEITLDAVSAAEEWARARALELVQ